ncbi:T9SS type A sorting domain-containing protein [Hymenobacter radiodurans]|uniref:T9SS type A sorting domain-containing protein n=1 Tax=Hymenobacter radiodurans TaxID=2496028 RepID=UPI001058F1A4|nr:T9SS type A sorting domain-containing protein [Hymenobacter radiodurans]
MKSYLGVEGQFLTVSNIRSSPVVRVTTPTVPLPVRAELGAMFSGENNTLFAINTDGGPNAGEMYQVDATTGNYLNVTLNSGLGLFRGDASTLLANRPLPVTLTNFDARPERASVALRWATATEIGTDNFRVERSTDNGQAWAAIGSVKAANAPQGRTYSFVDEAPQTGPNYYRLAIVDLDGSIAFSPIKSVDFQPAQQAISVYPNPAQDQFAVELPQLAAPGSTLQVQNSLGQQVWTQSLEGQRTVRVNTHNWAAGVYHIKVSTTGRSEMQKLVIQP